MRSPSVRIDRITVNAWSSRASDMRSCNTSSTGAGNTGLVTQENHPAADCEGLQKCRVGRAARANREREPRAPSYPTAVRAFAALAVVITACYSPAATPGAPCDPAIDHCPAGQMCVLRAGEYICSTTE